MDITVKSRKNKVAKKYHSVNRKIPGVIFLLFLSLIFHSGIRADMRNSIFCLIFIWGFEIEAEKNGFMI